MRVLDRWRESRARKRTQRHKEAALGERIERMVQESDPSIRTVAGYRRQLREPVESAVAYFEGLIGAIPGPFSLAPGNWDRDPLIHAFFVSPDEIRSLLRHCTELTSFFRDSGEESAIALVTATKTERTVFGTAMKGDLIQRDVARTAVEFHDHRVVAPVASEEESRRRMVQRGLNLLAAATLEKALETQALREELVAQRRTLAVKLSILRSRERGLERLLAGGDDMQAEARQAQQLLREIDARLQELAPETGTPGDVLKKLEGVLGGAEHFLRKNTVRMRLDWMGVKVGADSPESGREITLTELEIPERLKRVVMLTRIESLSLS